MVDFPRFYDGRLREGLLVAIPAQPYATLRHEKRTEARGWPRMLGHFFLEHALSARRRAPLCSKIPA